MLRDPGKWLFVNLLNNRILLKDEIIVPAFLEFEPNPNFADDPGSAVITMSDGGGQGNTETHILYRNAPIRPPDEMKDGNIIIPKEDGYYIIVDEGTPGWVGWDEINTPYNPDKPDVEYCREKIRWDILDEGIVLHVWAHSNEVRDHIIMKVKHLITQAKMNDYRFCTKYQPSNGECITTMKSCDAPLKQTVDSIENRCPYPQVTDPADPNYRDPKTYFEMTGIRLENLILRGQSTADQLGITPPIYHTTLSYDYIRDEYMVLETVPYTDFSVDIKEKE